MATPSRHLEWWTVQAYPTMLPGKAVLLRVASLLQYSYLSAHLNCLLALLAACQTSMVAAGPFSLEILAIP